MSHRVRRELECGIPWRCLICACLLLALGASMAQAQEVGVQDFDWLAGSWHGIGPKGTTAEITYMKSEANVLPALFRLYDAEKLIILEIITLVQEEDGVFLYVRHFDDALVPMECDRALKLHLVGRDGDSFVFDNVRKGQSPVRSTITRTERGFTSKSDLVPKDGKESSIRVSYERVPAEQALPSPATGVEKP